MRVRATTAVFAVLLAAACGGDATSEERAACRTFHEFEATQEAEEIQRLRDELADEAARSGNDELRAAAESFEAELTKGDVDAAGTAVGRFRDECERLGVHP